MQHRCPSLVADCAPAALCPGCYGYALFSRRGQAEVQGQVWMERSARAGDEPPLPAEVAAQLVEQLCADPRVRAELAPYAIAGAAAWWDRRPARYRR